MLTFMYDEDRQTALSMYSALFDRASDTESLISLLNSPTRQAVLLARCYNARERDLAVRGQSGKGDADVESGSVPDFVKVIEDLTYKAEEKGILSSYVSAWSDTTGYGSVEPSFEAGTEGSECVSEKPSANEQLPSKASAASPADSEISSVTPESPSETPEIDGNTSSVGCSLITENASDTERNTGTDRSSDLLTDFMQEPSEGKASMPEPVSPSGQSNGTDAVGKTEAFPDSDPPSTNPDRMEQDDSFGSESAYDLYLKSARQNNSGVSGENRSASAVPESAGRELSVPLLILYILVAVPVTALLLVLLLIPTAVALALSVFLMVLGVQIASSAFSGFAVFADIMVVLGSSLVLIAFSLLFFWLFIWLIGSVMVNLINSVIVLGEKVVMSGGDED